MKKVLILVFTTLAISSANANLTVPSRYYQTSDSPWNIQIGSEGFYLETFEDGIFNSPGVIASAGSVIGPGAMTDSVDGDDGQIDDSGNLGHSFSSSNGNTGITFTFNAEILGALPKRAGLVWTDGQGIIGFEAFKANGESLGYAAGTHAGFGLTGSTDEDRFYGCQYEGGIGSITIWNRNGGIEIDHLQYGVVPEPSTLIALTIGIASIMRNRKGCK